MPRTAEAVTEVGPNDPTCGVMTINPHRPNGRTIVMTHGAWHTYRHYLATFDDRPGWAYDFAAAGYRVILADYPGIGSSPKVADPTEITTEYIVRGLERIIDAIDGPVDVLVHSMSGPIGIALLESRGDRIGRLIAVAPAQPIQMAEEIPAVEELDDVTRVVYPTFTWDIPRNGWTEGDRDFVIHCIGPGSRFPAVDLDVYLASLTPLWGGLSTERPYRLADPTPIPEPDLFGTVALVVSGTHDISHPRAFDQKLVDWLAARGAETEFLHLGDIGIVGNGHMMMLEENSSEIASLIIERLNR